MGDIERLRDESLEVFRLFDTRWALLTAGTIDDFNTMTICWGSLGSIWGGPEQTKMIATVYVKPKRYTYEYMTNSDLFTISFFPKGFRRDLIVLGEKSGRDCDKVALTSLKPIEFGGSVSFEQADTVFACRKLYTAPMSREDIPQALIREFYVAEEPHHIFMGEIFDYMLPQKG